MAKRTAESSGAAVAHLTKAAAAGDDGAIKALVNIQRRWDLWRKAIKEDKTTTRETKDKLDAAFASFRNSIEAGVPLGAKDKEMVEKLRRVEVEWQEYMDTKAQAIEDRKTAKDARKLAQKHLEDAVENARQLPLFEGAVAE